MTDDTSRTANPPNVLDGVRQVAGDVMLTEFVTATSVNEEVGELLGDLGRFAKLLQQHGQKQVEIGRRFFSDLTQVRSVDRWFGAHLHLLRASADNQLSLLADAARLQADALARTRHALGVGFAAAEQTLAGRRAHPAKDTPRH